MPRGGYRPGAGRPKGAKNKKTLQKRAIQQRAADANLTPLEFMLRIMRDESEDPKIRAQMAYYAAPYVHPKADKLAGKKEALEEKAKAAGKGRFAACPAPFKVLK